MLGAALMYLAAELPDDVLEEIGDDPPGGAVGRALASFFAKLVLALLTPPDGADRS